MNKFRFFIYKYIYIYIYENNLIIFTKKKKIILPLQNLSLGIKSIKIQYFKYYNIIEIFFLKNYDLIYPFFKKKIINFLRSLFFNVINGYFIDLNLYGLSYKIYQKKQITFFNLESSHFNKFLTYYSNYILLCNKNNFILTGNKKNLIKYQMAYLKNFKKHDNYKKKGIAFIYTNK